MDAIRKSVIVHPSKFKGGVLSVPGDKSISQRVAMLAGVAAGESRVSNYLQSEDCLNTLGAMEKLGARTYVDKDNVLVIQGTAGKLLEPVAPLDLGNSGTGMRLMAGLLAGFSMTVELTGDRSLCSRPMGRIKDPLDRMGAEVVLLGEKGRPPIRIKGGNLRAMRYELPVASAQVKSCALLAGLHARGCTIITEPAKTRDHTERLFKTFGIPIEVNGLRIELDGYGMEGPRLKGMEISIPGDFSSAAYWLVAAAISKRMSVTVKNVGLNPRRTALIEVLRRMGVKVTIASHDIVSAHEPYGDITIHGGKLLGTTIGGEEIPNLIDELPILALAGAFADGRTRIRDACELRVKESDRIATMAENLRLIGAKVEEYPDGMEITGPLEFKDVDILNSYGDHRIAMSMAVGCMFASRAVHLQNVGCIETSYPGFWKDFELMGGSVE